MSVLLGISRDNLLAGTARMTGNARMPGTPRMNGASRVPRRSVPSSISRLKDSNRYRAS